MTADDPSGRDRAGPVGRGGGGGNDFPETRWTRILAARGRPELRRAVLEELCAARWQALYVYARRRGLGPAPAEDAVQGLLLQLIEHDFLDRLDPNQGKLRNYLRRALQHYLINEHSQASAQKRGGGRRALPIEDVEARLPAAPEDPDRAFDREWALGIFEGALDELAREFASGERVGPFEILRDLFRFSEAPPYEELARRHGMSLSQLKSFVRRGRLRFRELVLKRVADGVGSAAEAEAELGELLKVLAS